MIVAIVSHTPLWVWPLLALLLYRGWLARRDRSTPLLPALLLPLVMLGLALSGLWLALSQQPASALAGAVSLLVVSWLSWRSSNVQAIRMDVATRRVVQRGSWQPLCLMVVIFVIKYSAGVALALHPQLSGELGFALPLAVLYGAFSGIFTGRLLRILHLCSGASNDAGQMPAKNLERF